MALIDVVVLGFLLSEPPLVRTQDAQLPALLAARLLYSQEPPIPSDDEAKESTPKPIHQEVTEKGFEVFYLEDALSTSTTCTLAEMSFEKKTLNLLALLAAHTGGSSPTITATPRPPTPAATHILPADVTDKKRK